eukprot:3755960-Prymnesium_polylepis.1
MRRDLGVIVRALRLLDLGFGWPPGRLPDARSPARHVEPQPLLRLRRSLLHVALLPCYEPCHVTNRA